MNQRVGRVRNNKAVGWLPPVVPLVVLWVAGVVLLGSVALVLYWTVRVLVQLVTGSI